MKITAIIAEKERIRLCTDFDGSVQVRQSVPTVGPKPGRTLCFGDSRAEHGEIIIPRKEAQCGGRDSIFSRFDVFKDGEAIDGVKYVTDVADNIPIETTPYPQPDIIKMLGLSGEMAKKYNIRQGLMNINLPALMAVGTAEETIPYEFNGRVYRVRRRAVEDIDRYIKSVPMVTMILLNSPRLFGSTGEKA
ncbi:MAG: hypothetical protein II920_03680, partial [Clostridia bacterium]|nr:hypothetical protein [Clostridia bacterium]